jgi:hypothetical protein
VGHDLRKGFLTKTNVYFVSYEGRRVVVLFEDVLVAEEEVDVPLEAVLVQRGAKPGSTSPGVGVDAF